MVEELAAAADPGVIAMPSGRYFGFVIGGALPASVTASYLVQDGASAAVRDQMDWVPEFSRRARGFAVYAALRSLGATASPGSSSGAVRRRAASRIAFRSCPARSCWNEVVLNQVLFRFGDDGRTDGVLARVQADGDVWMSGTTWQGRKAIHVSVSNWQTGDAEIDLALDAFARAAQPGKVPAR